jgi:uncharacterized protein YxjI
MAISVNCQCGKAYQLKDEFAGRILKCRECGTSLQVDELPGQHIPAASIRQKTAAPTAEASPRGRLQPVTDVIFRRDRFLLRQKVLTLSEKYDVCDDNGQPILFIERPLHFWRNLGALLVGVIAWFITLMVIIGIGSALPETLGALFILPGIFSAFAAGFVVAVLLSKKRDITIYRDQSRQEPLIRVLQDKKFEWFTATFTVRDTQGDLAKFQKNYFYDLFRKQWNCYSPNGSLICQAKEDSIILALLRRFLGTFYGLLRINFIIVKGNTEQVIGEFNRNFTLLDRYVLDLSADRQNVLNRKIAVALGVILDTGEKR